MEVEYLDIEVEKKADAINFFSVNSAKGVIENNKGKVEIVANSFHRRQNNFNPEKEDEFIEILVNGVNNDEQYRYNFRLNNKSFNNCVEKLGTKVSKWKGTAILTLERAFNNRESIVLMPSD